MTPRSFGTVATKGRSPGERPFVVLALPLLLAFAACETPELGNQTETLELDSGTVRLEPGVAVVDVVLRTTGEIRIEPETVRVRVGDVVIFTAGDARMHAVAFERDRLAPAAVAFLEQTGQLRSPPLLTTDARWVVSFEGAPPGRYPFVDTSQGARGVVEVAQAPPDA